MKLGDANARWSYMEREKRESLGARTVKQDRLNLLSGDSYGTRTRRHRKRCKLIVPGRNKVGGKE